MLMDIAERLKINLVGIPVIGDALRDIQAAQAAGVDLDTPHDRFGRR